ncbi:SGNH/GDSL hydrolase family protein [Arthrobacter ginkgonis]|uniref:SGNH/GDSL hydrolase family protein n=1 Tax=Arthrobacter ginkgonis TaxID=1630594 RepID=A0ABP7DIM6_9MICC
MVVVGVVALGLAFWAFGIRPAQEKAAAMNAIAADVKGARGNGGSDTVFITEESEPAPDLPDIAVVGDSYTGGSGMDSGKDYRWPALVSEALDIPVTLRTEGGTGYVKTSEGGVNLVVRAGEVPDADLVVFFGSRNDDAGYDAVLEGAMEAFAAAEDAAPDAELLVIGPPWVDGNPPATVRASRDAVKAAAKEVGATFVDPLSRGWFAEGKKGLIGSDGVHPTDAGHEYLAEKIEPLISKALK